MGWGEGFAEGEGLVFDDGELLVFGDGETLGLGAGDVLAAIATKGAQHTNAARQAVTIGNLFFIAWVGFGDSVLASLGERGNFKSEIRSSKSETILEMQRIECSKRESAFSECFPPFDFSDLVSDFEIRVSEFLYSSALPWSSGSHGNVSGPFSVQTA